MNIFKFRGKVIINSLEAGEYCFKIKDFTHLPKEGTNNILVTTLEIIEGEAEGGEISVYNNIPKNLETDKDKIIANILVNYFRNLKVNSFRELKELIGTNIKANLTVKNTVKGEYYNLSNIAYIEGGY